MVTNQLGAILQELGKSTIIPISDLHPDRNNSCLVGIKGGIQIQLEMDRSGDNLLIGCDLGAIPPGRYKENLFREALKANGLPPPRNGIFAYSKQTDHLILFETLHARDLTGEKVADYLVKFLEKVVTWQSAISSNDIPIISTMKTSRFGGIFGLKP